MTEPESKEALIVCVRAENARNTPILNESVPRECERCHSAVVVHPSTLQAAAGYVLHFVCAECDAGAFRTPQEAFRDRLEAALNSLENPDIRATVQRALRSLVERN
jgi:hypothetical protein